MLRRPPTSPLFPYTTLFRSAISTISPSVCRSSTRESSRDSPAAWRTGPTSAACSANPESFPLRSEEHTSELQSRGHLVCRLLLEKKKEDDAATIIPST